MLRYAANKKKYRVAPMQPPYPLDLDDFVKITAPDAIIKKRHDQLKSWDKLSRELGGANVGTLSAIAKGKRYPTAKLIEKMNMLYTCHVTPRTVTVTPCAVCGSTRHTHHRARQPDPVIRLKRLRELLQSPYLMS